MPYYRINLGQESMSLKAYEFREALSSPWLKSSVVNSLFAGTHTLTYFISELQTFLVARQVRNCLFSEVCSCNLYTCCL